MSSRPCAPRILLLAPQSASALLPPQRPCRCRRCMPSTALAAVRADAGGAPPGGRHASSVHARRRGGRHRRARRPARPHPGPLPGTTPLGTPTWLWALADEPRRSLGAGRPAVDAQRAHRLGDAARPPRAAHAHLGAGRPLAPPRHADARLTRAASFVAAVGAPDSPTPIGRFSVTDPIATGDAGGPYGWYAFGLSGHQPHLPPGLERRRPAGDPRHERSGRRWGRRRRPGCLRVSASALAVLKRALRPGTPVVIHP